MPRQAGAFEGERMHSCGYKTPEIFRGKRVLVVGAGNSGCDIAVDASEHASRAFLSVRRGYHFVPKYVFGRPIDQVGELSLKLRLPLPVRRALNQLVLRAVVGKPEEYGLPRPDHRLLESHPIVNSRILPAIRRGDLRPKPDVAQLRGRDVTFEDGSSEPIDLIVFATGYQVTFPFFDPGHLNSADGRPDFYLHLFHPTSDDLFILGMIQPDSGVWPLMDLQARAVAGYLRARAADGKGARVMDRLKQGPRPDLSGGIRYLKSERHRYEVEHSTYARQLRKVIRLLEA
jgi:cation diffusion facilitator CzcD-associated flavoprotein CzcO